jgi:hypothetical protein
MPPAPAPTPSPASECVSPLGPKGGEQYLLAGEGVGGTQFGRLERKSVCAPFYLQGIAS